MSNLANCEDPDEILRHPALHESQQCLVRQNQSSEKEIYYIWELPLTFNNAKGHPDLTVSNCT